MYMEFIDAKIWISKNASLCRVFANRVTYTCTRIAYHSRRKVSLFHLFTFIPQENVHNYQLLRTFIVFMCKNLPKSFHSCKTICEKQEGFSPRIISIIWYKKAVGYYEMIWCHVLLWMYCVNDDPCMTTHWCGACSGLP